LVEDNIIRNKIREKAMEKVKEDFDLGKNVVLLYELLIDK